MLDYRWSLIISLSESYIQWFLVWCRIMILTKMRFRINVHIVGPSCFLLFNLFALWLQQFLPLGSRCAPPPRGQSLPRSTWDKAELWPPRRGTSCSVWCRWLDWQLHEPSWSIHWIGKHPRECAHSVAVSWWRTELHTAPNTDRTPTGWRRRWELRVLLFACSSPGLSWCLWWLSRSIC